MKVAVACITIDLHFSYTSSTEPAKTGVVYPMEIVHETRPIILIVAVEGSVERAIALGSQGDGYRYTPQWSEAPNPVTVHVDIAESGRSDVT